MSSINFSLKHSYNTVFQEHLLNEWDKNEQKLACWEQVTQEAGSS